MTIRAEVMAVPALWPWGAHLLMSLLSLGSGLDTLEGESPATSFQPPSPSRTPILSLWLVGFGVSRQGFFVS